MLRKSRSATPFGLTESQAPPTTPLLSTVPFSPLTQTAFPLTLTPRKFAVVPLSTGTQDWASIGRPIANRNLHTTIIVVNTRVMDSPPIAKVVPVSTALFGDTRTDPYAWLRDRADPDTIKYLEAENAYT